MARSRSGRLVLLLAGLLAAAGCVGPVAQPPDPAPEAGDGPDSETETARGTEVATVAIRLALTADSRIPLDVQSVQLDPEPDAALAVETAAGRLVPGEEVRVATLTLEQGASLAPLAVTVTFYDGIGQVNFTAQLSGGPVGDDVEQTLRLRDRGPTRIGFVASEGPLEVRPETPRAVPQYGYLLWPDGRREAVPGFDHPIHVPAAYPNLPAGEEAAFLVEIPGERDALWRVDDGEPVRGRELALSPDPGLHHVRLSVGPGDATTSLSVHTDLEQAANGTIAAATPGVNRSLAGVNEARHEIPVQAEAHGIRLDLSTPEQAGPRGNLDLYLEDPDGETIASSADGNASREAIAYTDRLRGGDYTAVVRAEAGAGHEYRLGTLVDY